MSFYSSKELLSESQKNCIEITPKFNYSDFLTQIHIKLEERYRDDILSSYTCSYTLFGTEPARWTTPNDPLFTKSPIRNISLFLIRTVWPSTSRNSIPSFIQLKLWLLHSRHNWVSPKAEIVNNSLNGMMKAIGWPFYDSHYNDSRHNTLIVECNGINRRYIRSRI